MELWVKGYPIPKTLLFTKGGERMSLELLVKAGNVSEELEVLNDHAMHASLDPVCESVSLGCGSFGCGSMGGCC